VFLGQQSGQQSAKLAGKVAVDTGRRFENLLRAIAAELHLLNGMTAAREMFGRSYFSLGIGEKTAVDQATIGIDVVAALAASAAGVPECCQRR
jgi:hypothetical protein